MSKYKEIYGVDISKDVFDVYGEKSVHYQFKNGGKGFASFLKSLPKGSLVVMELRLKNSKLDGFLSQFYVLKSKVLC